MNLIYSMMRFIAMTLDMAQDLLKLLPPFQLCPGESFLCDHGFRVCLLDIPDLPFDGLLLPADACITIYLHVVPSFLVVKRTFIHFDIAKPCQMNQQGFAFDTFLGGVNFNT